MTQDAVVTKVLSNGMAEVAVSRGTACGSNCGNCESCVFQSEIKTLAKNSINAVQGEKVIIESMTSRIFGAAFLLYIVPFILFFVGYAVAAGLAFTEAQCMLMSFAFFLATMAIVVVFQRINKKKKPITFEIIRFR